MTEDTHQQPHEPDVSRLVSGELSSEEFERILRGAEQDPRTSEEIDFLADLVAAIDEKALEQSPRRAQLVTEPEEPPVVEHPRFSRVARVAMVAAGIAALVFGLRFFGVGGGPEERDWDLGPPRYVHTFLRNGSATLARDLAHAMEPYSRSEFANSAETLRTFLQAHPEHATAQFYLGASLEAEGKAREAEAWYRHAVADPDLVGDHALWRLAHLHLLEGELELAREALLELEERAGVFAANATELIEFLESS